MRWHPKVQGFFVFSWPKGTLRPRARTELFFARDDEIVRTYNSEIRGILNETDINPPAVLGRLTERGAISGVKENLRCIICVGLANHTDTTEVSNGQSKSST